MHIGAWLYVFKHEEWKKLYYYNCTLHPMSGHANVPLGLTFASIGLVCEFLYFPFMIAMWQKGLLQYSCYKFMFLLGIIDMITVPCNAIISGSQGVLGLHFCTNPDFFFFTALIPMAGWFGTTATCSLLAIERFFEFFFPNFAKKLFGKRLMCFWLCIPVIYWFYIIMTLTPPLYNVRYHAFYIDPYYGTEDLQGNPVFYEFGILIVNSCLTVIILGGSYLTLCIVITVKAKFFKVSSMTKLQRVMLLQSMFICFEIFIVAIVYLCNQFFLFPEFVVVIEQLSWICTHADTPIVYLILNKTLRKAVLEMFLIPVRKSRRKIIHIASYFSTIAIRNVIHPN